MASLFVNRRKPKRVIREAEDPTPEDGQGTLQSILSNEWF